MENFSKPLNAIIKITLKWGIACGQIFHKIQDKMVYVS